MFRLGARAGLLAGVVVTASVIAIAMRYGSLPDELPVSRAHDVSKSWFVALRVTAVNAVILGAIEVLARTARRTSFRASARTMTAVLMTTVAVKTGLETVELLLLLARYPALTATVVACIVIGLVATALFGRPLLSRAGVRELSLTRREQVLLSVLAVCLVALELPLLTS